MTGTEIAELSAAWAAVIAIVSYAFYAGNQARTLTQLIKSVDALTELITRKTADETKLRARVLAIEYAQAKIDADINRIKNGR